MGIIIQKCKCCGVEFTARAADIKRGWGLYCSKSCKAIKQENKTGQFAKLLSKSKKRKVNPDYATYLLMGSKIGRMLLAKEKEAGVFVCDEFDNDYFDYDYFAEDPSWDAHKH